MITKCGVVGQGFVGTAVREGLRNSFQVVTYDIKQPDDLVVYSATGTETIPAIDRLNKLVETTDGPIFVCLPTPMKPDGSCDISIVEGVVKDINECAPNRVVAIKSTIPPGTTDYLNTSYTSVYVCFNPEFLRERSAIEDFKNQERIVIGGPYEATDEVKQVYQIAFPNVSITRTNAVTAEMVKYITNCFLATKVSFANEVKQICDKLDIDYDRVIEIATKDSRLGTSHWGVPGNDGTGLCGFSGSCFPKDLNGLMYLARELKIDPKVMQAVWDKNLEIRPEKDWEKMIGRAVV
ncbi:MAG: nucleotide sugar dehydrogenase [Proteobacteria bacterium]|jgi:UDPglucose 6-dehydrogenase|nr:nucleotide sugar dehydrogenase [Pseudomonadota bacterium]